MAEIKVAENLFDFNMSDGGTRYSTSIARPQYLPKNECPSLNELYDNRKYNELVTEIEASKISSEVKDFLKLAATRHIVFNYAKIADYYAHAPEDVQNLMEKSALVIIDFNDAIANGYVKLADRLRQIEYNQIN